MEEQKQKKRIPFQPPTIEELEEYYDNLIPMARLHRDGIVTYSKPLDEDNQK